ncbi:diablo homolog, mitochondrial-like [Patiria miniata]|uniref:Direct IAP-binding protein with low pI n=1 Tax=Patiria miniata TaxID=46514 RepID=A0A914B938_PATMI|nr:diablo homolog, mitochondrial-like [Patiria miniata]
MEPLLSLCRSKLSKGMVWRCSKQLQFCERWRWLFQSVLNRHRPVQLSPNRGLWSLRILTRPLYRSWFVGLCGLSGGGVLLSAMPCVPVGSNEKPSAQSTSASLQSNAGSLTHRELIKNAAAIAVDSSCILLTHAALAAISLHKEYSEMVNILRLLLEEHAQFVGPPSQEDDLWQDIIRQRVEIEDNIRAIEDANVMLTSAILVVERAAEAAYQADAELSALTAGQHLQLVQAQLGAARKVSQKAKEELTNIQAQTIKKEGDGEQDGS